MTKSSKLPAGLVKKVLLTQFGQINKKFWKELKAVNIAQIIVGFIQKGISPVDISGAMARFKKYSQSYINRIRGINPSGKRTQKSKASSLASRYGKKLSPVSMRLTGEMLDSLSFNQSNGVLTAADEKWQYHNGEDSERAPNMPERRLLPDRPGERFNRRIEQNITEALAKALGLKGSRVKKFMKVKFNIK